MDLLNIIKTTNKIDTIMEIMGVDKFVAALNKSKYFDFKKYFDVMDIKNDKIINFIFKDDKKAYDLDFGKFKILFYYFIGINPESEKNINICLNNPKIIEQDIPYLIIKKINDKYTIQSCYSLDDLSDTFCSTLVNSDEEFFNSTESDESDEGLLKGIYDSDGICIYEKPTHELTEKDLTNMNYEYNNKTKTIKIYATTLTDFFKKENITAVKYFIKNYIAEIKD